jgi:uncharacterized protein (TIGR00106 family)
MKVLIDISVIPMGVGLSVSEYIAECQKVFKEAGLVHTMHAFGTNVEGEWDEVFSAVKKCHERVHKMGAPRISTTIRLGTRTDHNQSLNDKIKSVESKI